MDLVSRALRKLASTLYWTTGLELPVAAIGRPIGIARFAEPHHALRAAFIHVPKAGGNSVRHIVFGGAPSAILGGHGTAQQLRAADPRLYADYFTFAVVRHPFERLKSAFWYLKAGGRSRYEAVWARRNLGAFETFDAFVRKLGESPRFQRRVMRYLHFIPQVQFVCDVDGTVMVDELIRLEAFDEGMRSVCDRLGVPYEPRHENRSSRPAANESDESDFRAICATLYAADYQILGYRP